MTLNTAGGLVTASQIPNFHLFVISYSDEDILIKIIPRDILHNRVVSLKVFKGILCQLILVGGLDIPNANTEVV